MSRATSDVSYAEEPIAAVLRCPVCASAVDIRSRHVGVQGSAVRIYCSEECLRGEGLAADLLEPELYPAEPEASGRSWLRSLVAGGALLGMVFVSDTLAPDPPPPLPPPAAPAVVFGPPVDESAARSEPVATPPAPPEWVAEVLRDVWLHPLAGPIRRMPRLDGAVFGAERPGERPPECKNGHCGVDIGGDMWGEPVLAAHDGVVDRVQRGPNEEHGGLYVRLAHRDGTVFTQYFHLAAIPRWLAPGRKISAGEIIGLLGDTGVRNSGPHLHFTISVKPTSDLPEQFIDPEPLIALWPLRLAPPHGAGDGAFLSVAGAPGVVHGAAVKRRRERLQATAAAAADEPPAPTPAAQPAATP
jgi:hypothetical protein